MIDRFVSYISLFLLYLTIFIHPAQAIEVSAEGATQRQAINNALKQAVEMQFGATVESNTLVENFQVVRQHLLSHTKGYVKSYKILKQDKDNTGRYLVTLDALVDDASLKNSTDALNSLMKMATHPQLYIVGVNEDINSISNHSNAFRLLTQTVEHLFRKEFKFKVLDTETVRLSDHTKYRFSDRKNNLKRAKRAKADYVIFVEILKESTRSSDLVLRLEGVDLNTNLSIKKIEHPFNMDDWTPHDRTDDEFAALEAQSQIFNPVSQLGGALVQELQTEIYENGKRYELVFEKFNSKTLKYLETDLGNLSGYVRHKLNVQKKNALTLSYWSMLQTGPLHDAVDQLLKGQDQTFSYDIIGQQLIYRFDDPMFE